MLSPKSITTSAFCFCLLMTFCAVSAKADTMYTYTGPQFTEFGEANCPPECNITGSFTLATPLPANEVGAAITAKTPFAFSSGPFTGTAFGPFLISTNAAGAIDGWAIAVGEALDDGDIAVIFSPVSTSTGVPEPASGTLLIAGLVGLAVALKKSL